MNKLVAAIVLVGILFAFPVRAADAVEPLNVTFTNARTDTVSFLSNTEYYEGTSILFTNCLLKTTGGATQSLASVTITVTIGRPETNVDYTASIQNTNGGLWFLTATVPTGSVGNQCNFQVKLTDVNTNIYIYPWKKIYTKISM